MTTKTASCRIQVSCACHSTIVNVVGCKECWCVISVGCPKSVQDQRGGMFSSSNARADPIVFRSSVESVECVLVLVLLYTSSVPVKAHVQGMLSTRRLGLIVHEKTSNLTTDSASFALDSNDLVGFMSDILVSARARFGELGWGDHLGAYQCLGQLLVDHSLLRTREVWYQRYGPHRSFQIVNLHGTSLPGQSWLDRGRHRCRYVDR